MLCAFTSEDKVKIGDICLSMLDLLRNWSPTGCSMGLRCLKNTKRENQKGTRRDCASARTKNEKKKRRKINYWREAVFSNCSLFFSIFFLTTRNEKFIVYNY